MVPLAVRLKNQIEQEDNLTGLDVLCQRLPFFFQGVAALTGMRCQRENLERWSHWEEAGLVDLDAHKRHIKKSFHYVLILAGLYLTEDNDAEPLTYLLLEPMYWLEEYSNSQKGEI